MDGFVAAATNEAHTGAMVALVPTKDDADRLALEDGEPVEELHCTLLYLGEAEDLDDAARAAIFDAVAGIAAEYEPFDANGFAISLFNPSGDEPCVVLGLSGADLAGLHHELVGEIEPSTDQHQPWIPHITLAYDPDPATVGDLADLTGPVSFDRIRIAFAGDATDYELGSGAVSVAARPPYPGQKWRHGWIPIAGYLAHLRAAIRSGEVDRYKLNGGLNGDVYLVDHADGTSTIEKRFLDLSDTFGHGLTPKRQADAEQLAGHLGHSIGAPVPKVLRIAPDVVVMDVLDGDRWSDIEREALATGDPQDAATLAVVREKLYATKEGIRLGLFDLLTDNFDRGNGTNWIVDDNSRPGGYDHAFAWSGVTRAGASDPPEYEELSPFSEQFTRLDDQGRRVWGPNPLTPADIAFLSTRLAELERDFDQLGHHDWWEFAVARLRAIGQYAAGEEPRFA